MKKAEWYTLLPTDLVKAAYKSLHEMAWPKKQALQVVEVLRMHGLVVDAVEPWLPTKPGPTPLGLDWHIGRVNNKNKFPDTAVQFIEQFAALYPLKKSQQPVFNLSAERVE